MNRPTATRPFPLACLAVTLALLWCAGAVAGDVPETRGTAPDPLRTDWSSYGERYAIVVMGGNVTGQMYRWYWNDTSGEVWALMDWGFAPENIIYLSYGDSANAHPELVDAVSTHANVAAAFATIADRATPEDLVHVWWIDHGSPSGFEVHNGFVYFTELRDWIDAIDCRAYLGAYNPCYSGAIVPHLEGLCTATRRVITATSVNASQGNSYGWAGKWRLALRGGRPDDYVPRYTDTNHDGQIAWDEAYEWETPHSNAHGEYPLFDDNCDGVGGELRNPATYDSSGTDPTRDGYYGQFYSLMAWADPEGAERPRPPHRTFANGGNSGRCGPREDVVIVWREAAAMPAGVARGASGLIDEELYLFGGHPAPAPVHYRYDIGADLWSTDPSPLPVPGSLVRGVVQEGQLYVLGGHTPGSDDLRRYHPTTDVWETRSSPFPSGARECCKYGAGAVGQRIYFGYVEERYSYEPILSAWEYDIGTDAWSQIALPPEPERMYAASASDGEYCYVIGGIAHDASLSVLQDAIRYDPVADAWAAIDPLPAPLAFADGDFLGDRLVIAGGGAGYEPWPARAEVYCWSETQGWQTATPLPAPVGAPHVELATIDGRDYIFVFGGYDGGYLSSLYVGEILWDPTDVPDDSRPATQLVLSAPSPALPGRPVRIAYALPRAGHARLAVRDAQGRSVATLVDRHLPAGQHVASWEASGVAAG
ncbi:MAG: hypothetical protein GF330_13660, partial [Candidatus Eisenbacteria bacterium]|nr:hypothetical protein [Candidatus Eisenbacteria bacterium]